MAKRESQGLQIGLIVFVMVSVLFMVTTVLFWKQAGTARTDAASYQTQLTDANNRLRIAEDENERIKENLLGYSRQTPLDDIEREVNQLMLAYGTGLREEQRDLMHLPEQMARALTEKTDRLKQSSDFEANLNKQAEADRQAHADELAAAQKKRDGEIALRTSESAKHTQQRQQMLATQKKNDDLYRAELTKQQDAITDRDVKISAKDKEIKTLNIVKDDLIDKVDQRRTALAVPDGRIIWVNQTARLVWVNLGHADKVRPQMTFDVFDADDNNLSQSDPKGRIEIHRVVDDHSSEAVIRSDLLSNPIMARDAIDSHVWERGQPLRFALAGVLDVDDDGKNDRDLLARLIELNGGVIDAMIDSEGNMVDRDGNPGTMSIDTRYLVIGERPPTDDTSGTQAFEDMWKAADTLGVERISVSRILEYVGYDGKERSVALGRSARAVDFKAQPLKGVSRTSSGRVSALYGQTRPPLRRIETDRAASERTVNDQ